MAAAADMVFSAASTAAAAVDWSTRSTSSRGAEAVGGSLHWTVGDGDCNVAVESQRSFPIITD